MTTTIQKVDKATDTIKGLADQMISLTGDRIDQASEALDYDCYTLEATVKLRIARVESLLIGPIAILSQNASYHLLRAYYHASPAFMAILAAIWGVIVIIWNVVKWIISIVQIIQELHIDDLLANHWEWFKEARDGFRSKVAELSEAIGWGADGFLHLLHAVQGGTAVLGGLTGKSYKWMEAEWMEKTGSVLEKVKFNADYIQGHPGEVLETIFQLEMFDNARPFGEWGEELTTKIGDALGKGTTALQGLSGIANELAAIQEGMPEVIRKNIPVGIWNSLEKFSDIIDTELLPRLRIAERKVILVQTMFAQYSGRLSTLASLVAHPGTALLGIDDLPSYARNIEEWAVDDIASRQFNQWSEEERTTMQPDLDRFELIDAAALALPPALPFMSIEEPARAALMGITAEPQETWFVGGYKSTY